MLRDPASLCVRSDVADARVLRRTTIKGFIAAAISAQRDICGYNSRVAWRLAVALQPDHIPPRHSWSSDSWLQEWSAALNGDSRLGM